MPASSPSIAPATTSLPMATSTISPNAAQHPGMKLYRNDEYGFEFWYPDAWSAEENTYGNSGTKFNVIAYPTRADGKYPFYDPLIVSVVTSDFANGEYSYLKSSARPTVIDGKEGLEYKYTQDTHYDDVIIPIDTSTSFIIGNDDDAYAADFSNILSSFRFLK